MEMDGLVAKFKAVYGIEPQLAVRCPGRVNLIGEHIDYHGYGVFPMATNASTLLLAARNEKNLLEIRNVDDKYQGWESAIPCEWSGATPPKWFDYVLCGWKGATDHLGGGQFGYSILLTGNIPESSGLSSSSSLVCSSAMARFALEHENPFEIISKEDLAELCAKSEPLIGTLSGGMDQAAEILSEEGTALRIDFNPLRSKKIVLPDSANFVVVHSGAKLNKAATSHYNERVVEGRIIAQMLKRKYKIDSPSFFRLLDVQKLSGRSFVELLKDVSQLPEVMTKEDVISAIGDDFSLCLSENTKHMTTFTIRSRGRHVFSEAKRVDDFGTACQAGDVAEMGRLMNESHDSCSNDYDCSCPELDQLVESYRAAGALGVRLTGAGWGGCAVALFDADVNLDELSLTPPPLFVSKPAAGIELVRL